MGQKGMIRQRANEEMFLERAEIDWHSLSPQHRAAGWKVVVLRLENGRFLAALVQIELCELQVAVIAGGAIEPDPGEFNAFVP